uniref:Uncharacterized protein n=2 Tax=Lygus hesperus TaxID=30085 RepID=A0A146L8N2_LYGHE
MVRKQIRSTEATSPRFLWITMHRRVYRWEWDAMYDTVSSLHAKISLVSHYHSSVGSTSLSLSTAFSTIHRTARSSVGRCRYSSTQSAWRCMHHTTTSSTRCPSAALPLLRIASNSQISVTTVSRCGGCAGRFLTYVWGAHSKRSHGSMRRTIASTCSGCVDSSTVIGAPPSLQQLRCNSASDSQQLLHRQCRWHSTTTSSTALSPSCVRSAVSTSNWWCSQRSHSYQRPTNRRVCCDAGIQSVAPLWGGGPVSALQSSIVPSTCAVLCCVHRRSCERRYYSPSELPPSMLLCRHSSGYSPAHSTFQCAASCCTLSSEP